jgi:hypothetical protein
MSTEQEQSCAGALARYRDLQREGGLCHKRCFCICHLAGSKNAVSSSVSNAVRASRVEMMQATKVSALLACDGPLPLGSGRSRRRLDHNC